MTATPNPKRCPMEANKAGVPEAREPKRQFAPQQISERGRPGDGVPGAAREARKVSGDSCARSRVKASNRTPSSPAASNWRRRSSSGKRSGGAFSGARRESGWRSNVNAQTVPPTARARDFAASRTARWPTWTPSKKPAARNTGRGTAENAVLSRRILIEKRTPPDAGQRLARRHKTTG